MWISSRRHPSSTIWKQLAPGRNLGSVTNLRNRIPLDFHPEVEDALHSRKAVVALESTIISHGMPYPTNVSLSLGLEDIVRKTGAIPATIGILNGRVKIGMNKDQLEQIGMPRTENKVVKVSRRDIAPVIALRKDGGTTISGTMILAALAGIKVFATGGLGGVHRGGEITWDVSADLTELGRTPVAVVAAGAKSILDIGRTLEYLETQGVTVATYGEKDDFPAFFSPSSGFRSPWAVNNPVDAARIIHTSNSLSLGSGQFFGVPIPPSYQEAGAMIQKAVDQAIRESEDNGISKRGKEVTPWLLQRVADLTKGESLKSNVALIENTTSVGSQIAVELAKMEERIDSSPSRVHPVLFETEANTHIVNTIPTSKPEIKTPLPSPKLVVIGAAAVDITSKSNNFAQHSTSPGVVEVTLGGVARNMAEAAHRRSADKTSTMLVAPVGNDPFSTLLKEQSRQSGLRTDGLFVSGASPDVRTPVCNLLLNGSGNLVGGVADFEALDAVQPKQLLEPLANHDAQLVAVDGNVSSHLVAPVAMHCRQHGIPLWFEPTSIAKCHHIFPAIQTIISSESSTPTLSSPISFTSPNVLELNYMYKWANDNGLFDSGFHWQKISGYGLGTDFRSQLVRVAVEKDGLDLGFLVKDGVIQMAISMLPFFQHIVVKAGDKGVFIAMVVPTEDSAKFSWKNDVDRYQVVATTPTGETVVIKHSPPPRIEEREIISSTGAGDSLVGSLLADFVTFGSGAFYSPDKLESTLRRAQEAAKLSLKSKHAVSPLLEP